MFDLGAWPKGCDGIRVFIEVHVHFYYAHGGGNKEQEPKTYCIFWPLTGRGTTNFRQKRRDNAALMERMRSLPLNMITTRLEYEHVRSLLLPRHLKY